MLIKKAFFLSLSLCTLFSCRVTQERLSGKYVDKTNADSLKLNRDGSYVYIETLKSGASGRTDGQWKVENKRVKFTKDRTAFVGYRFEVNREKIDDKGSLKFLLGNTEKPLDITQVKISTNGRIVTSNKVIPTDNSVKIPDTFDFMVINTHHFANILIKDTLQTNYQYKVRVFPVERLYELDKIPFVIRGKKLNGTERTLYDGRMIKFKKTRK